MTGLLSPRVKRGEVLDSPLLRSWSLKSNRHTALTQRSYLQPGESRASNRQLLPLGSELQLVDRPSDRHLTNSRRILSKCLYPSNQTRLQADHSTQAGRQKSEIAGTHNDVRIYLKTRDREPVHRHHHRDSVGRCVAEVARKGSDGSWYLGVNKADSLNPVGTIN